MPDPTPSIPKKTTEHLRPVMLILVALLELAARATDLPVLATATWLAMGGVILTSLRDIGLRETYLLSLSGLITLLLYGLVPDAAGTVAQALNQASFLMAFILLLALLHAAAATSPSVAICGEYLTHQPPGRRYSALNLGTGILAVLFNLGVVSFLIPLIQRGIQSGTPDDPLNAIRERRQISAVLRGFGWAMVWSPTAVAPLALHELLPQANRALWMNYGIAVFALMLALGALEDRWRMRHLRRSGPRPLPVFPLGAVARFAAACGWLFMMTAVFVWMSGDTLVFGLLAACPFLAFGWMAVQTGFPERGAITRTGRRLAGTVVHHLPLSAPAAISLACSGYIGRAAAILVPAEQLSAVLRLDAMPDYLLLSALPPLLALVSLLGLSPIMLAVFFGTLFAALPELPADATLIAFALSCGWALSMTCSPFATVTLLIERVSGIPARRLTWGWNLRFTLLSALALVPVFYVLTGGA